MDIFDLVDIKHVKHPILNKFSLKMRSGIYFFLIAKNLTKFVQKVDTQSSTAPDHKSVYLSLHWTKEVPRGDGLGKFKNALLKDDHHVEQIHKVYPEFRGKSEYIQDKKYFGNFLKWKLEVWLFHTPKAKLRRLINGN